jgi:CheY-like chemotaxis protein
MIYLGKNIMVIDDVEDTVDFVSTLLKTRGYETTSALNGKEAFETLKSMKQKPDLVLVDMFMPEMSGRELCEKIREDEELKNLKLAFITVASFKEQGKQLLKKLDILDYIAKPFDAEDFLKRVEIMLKK